MLKLCLASRLTNRAVGRQLPGVSPPGTVLPAWLLRVPPCGYGAPVRLGASRPKAADCSEAMCFDISEPATETGDRERGIGPETGDYPLALAWSLVVAGARTPA